MKNHTMKSCDFFKDRHKLFIVVPNNKKAQTSGKCRNSRSEGTPTPNVAK